VADIVYLMLIMVNSQDDQFLLDQSQVQQNQIENYLGSDDLVSAKRAADLAVNLTQQVLKMRPTDTAVLDKAKIAKAYDLLVGALISALGQDYEMARGLAEQAITKANEAAQLDGSIADTANHLKEKAIEILNQIVGK
jgi:hypothetical protein